MVLEPEIYTPSIDANGTYINYLPSKEIVKSKMPCTIFCHKNVSIIN